MTDYSEIGISTERTSDDYLTLNSCGIERLSERDRGSMRRNGRVDYHILYIERGICHVMLGENEEEAGAGSIILFRPGEPQIYRFRAADGSISHYIHFTGKGCGELLERLGISEIRIFDMGISRRYEEISAEMEREYTMKQPCYETMCTAHLTALLGLIARKYALRNIRVSRLSESRISGACRRIYDNLSNPPTLAELASECCLSESRFTHLFSEVTGKSLHGFILSLRMEKAKELLSTDLSVKEVAAMVGYEDQNYFSRMFRKYTGTAPSAVKPE